MNGWNKMKMYRIYKMKNLVNQKIYIGYSHYDLEHFIWSKKMQVINYKTNKGKHAKISEALAEFGVDNFEVTEVASSDDKGFIKKLRKMYIDKYQSDVDEYGYNSKQGRVA